MTRASHSRHIRVKLRAAAGLVLAVSMIASAEDALPSDDLPTLPGDIELAPEQWRALRAGQVLTDHVPPREGSGPDQARALGVVEHAPSLVWSTLTDFESWPRFLPNMQSVEVLERSDQAVRLRSRLRVAFATIDHTVDYALDPDARGMTWEIDASEPHDIEFVEGAWDLVPIDGGTRCLVSYRVRVVTGLWVPGWIERRLVKGSLPDVIESLRGELARRAG